MHYVYLVRCADNTLYCGWTGAKYTRSRRPVQLIYAEEYLEKHEALSREWHLKHLSRAEKLRLAETARAERKPGTE